MGKTKIKTIDDSVVEEKPKAASKPKKTTVKEEDSLVAKLNAELGIKEKVDKSSEAGGAEEPAKLSETEVTDSVILEGAERPIESDKKDAIASLQHDKQKKSQKPGETKKIRSKKYLEKAKDLDRSKTYSVPVAIDMVKNLSYSKFNGTLEAHINTVQTGVRGFTSLPYATGAKIRILTFGKGSDKSGADIFGDDSTIEEILKGKINFDLIITTPDWMVKLAKAAKILGPRGLMPNPKNGTIITDPSADGLKKAVESFQQGKTEFKTEAKAPIIHIRLGKLSQPEAELSANVKTLLTSIGKSKIKKVTLSPTMGPAVKLDLSSI